MTTKWAKRWKNKEAIDARTRRQEESVYNIVRAHIEREKEAELAALRQEVASLKMRHAEAIVGDMYRRRDFDRQLSRMQ